ncbi:MAG: cell division protein FtsA [Bacteriovoracaceae bacterium]|nr:cell division protein FtsA [Bacteriovoracaceae bacterium]
MTDKNLRVAIDVGTTKVCTIIGADQPSGDTEILGVGSHPSNGLKKGSVVNIDQTVKSILSSVEEAKLMAAVHMVRSAVIGIAGSHIYSFNSSGVVAVKGKSITKEDVDRVLDAAKAIVIPSDREILHVIPQEFRVDNIRGIKDPTGMHGIRLEAHVHIVTGQTSLIQNLIRCVVQAGIQPEQIVLQPIASSRSVLTLEEKELGVVVIDIGGGTTDIAIWKEGSLIHSQIIPVGGNHFTNDLAVALKAPHNEAERIKIHHGSVLPEKVNQSSQISVQGISGTKPREVQVSYVSSVLGSRAEELFTLVKNEIEDKGYSEMISGGYVITGGGALIRDLVELAEYILERPAKIGYPIPFGGMTTVMQNPKFSTVLGLIREPTHGLALPNEESHVQNSSKENKQNKENKDETDEEIKHSAIMERFSKSIKSVLKDIF